MRRWGTCFEFQLQDGSIKTMPVVGVVQDTAMGAGDFLARRTPTLTWIRCSISASRETIQPGIRHGGEPGDDIHHIRALGA
jgi:hypothetical protein